MECWLSNISHADEFEEVKCRDELPSERIVYGDGADDARMNPWLGGMPDGS